MEEKKVSLDDAINKAKEYADSCNKKIVLAQENDDYYYFKTEKAFDDGAGNCYISKKDGTLIPERIWLPEIQELNSKFRENSKVIKINNN